MNTPFLAPSHATRVGRSRTTSLSLSVAVALLALGSTTAAVAATKIVRTTKVAKAGAPCPTAEQACIAAAGTGCATAACKDGKLDTCTTNYNKCVDDNQPVVVKAQLPAPTPTPVTSQKKVRLTEQDCQKQADECRNILCATSPAGNARFTCELNCGTGLNKCRKDNGLAQGITF